MTDKPVTMSDLELDDLLSNIESEIEAEAKPKITAAEVEQMVATDDGTAPVDIPDDQEIAELIAEEQPETAQPEATADHYADILAEVLTPTPIAIEATAAPDFSDATDDEGDGVYIKQSKPMVFDPDQFHKDLQFSKFALDDAMMRQPGLYAHYAEVAARLQRRADQLKLQVELVEAKVDNEIREEFLKTATKVTEVLVEKAIKRNQEYKSVSHKHLDAKMQAAMAKDMLEALRQRRDMLIQIGKDKREELAGEVRVMSADANRGDLKSRAINATKSQ